MTEGMSQNTLKSLYMYSPINARQRNATINEC